MLIGALSPRSVHGINETAGALLSKFTRQVHITTLFASLGPDHRRVLESNNAICAESSNCPVLFRRTADAMEFCEERCAMYVTPRTSHSRSGKPN